MRKLIYLFLLMPFLAAGQTYTQTTNSGKYKMYIPTVGGVGDSIVVWNGTDKLLKFVPGSGFREDLHETLTIGNTTNLQAIFTESTYTNTIDPYAISINNTATGETGSFNENVMVFSNAGGATFGLQGDTRGLAWVNASSGQSLEIKADNVVTNYTSQMPKLNSGSWVPTYAIKVNATDSIYSDEFGTVDISEHVTFDGVLENGNTTNECAVFDDVAGNVTTICPDQIIKDNGTAQSIIEGGAIATTDSGGRFLNFGATGDGLTPLVTLGISADNYQISKDSARYTASSFNKTILKGVISNNQWYAYPDKAENTVSTPYILATVDEIPTSGDFVPYTGATANVNLGDHTVTVEDATYTTTITPQNTTINYTGFSEYTAVLAGNQLLVTGDAGGGSVNVSSVGAGEMYAQTSEGLDGDLTSYKSTSVKYNHDFDSTGIHASLDLQFETPTVSADRILVVPFVNGTLATTADIAGLVENPMTSSLDGGGNSITNIDQITTLGDANIGGAVLATGNIESGGDVIGATFNGGTLSGNNSGDQLFASLKFLGSTINWADSTTYFYCGAHLAPQTGTGTRHSESPITGNKIYFNISLYPSTNIGSGESATVTLRNITQATTIVLTSALLASGTSNNVAGNLTFAITANDQLDIQVTTPSYATNPNGCLFTVDLTITN